MRLRLLIDAWQRSQRETSYRFLRGCKNAGVPARGTSFGGWLYRIDIESGTRDQPRDHRVRIPHFACSKLVAAPHEHRHLWHQLEESSRVAQIAAQSTWTVDRFADVWNDTLAPATQFVAKNS